MAEERVQRRLAAILAADVVGYSRLMGEDEEDTLSRLKTLRRELFDPKTKQFGGRIFKTTGDGAFVEFNSAVDAVKSAVQIQEALAEGNAEVSEDQKILLRIGISLGDVIVEGSDLYGNGVNVASRMEGLAEPGGICVSGNVHEHIGKSLEVNFEDLGEQSVKNIERPVRCYRVRLEPFAQQLDGAPPLPDKPSIAVLPFENMSGDPEQEYFADGITEDLITALSRFRWFFVIARNSSFTYKGSAVDVKRVARELGVKYVLEGSVRKGGDRIRITAQLIDATTGRHVWAERYDRDLHDIFAVQDEITEAITGAVAPAFASAEEHRANLKPPENLDAWACTMRGMSLWRTYQKDEVTEARRLFERAIELDPNFAPAYVGFSVSYAHGARLGFFELDQKKGLWAARKAIALDSEDAWAHTALGMIYFAHRDHPAAIAEQEYAIHLNPSFVTAHYYLSRAMIASGNAEDAIPHIQQSFRLSPRDPDIGHFHGGMARAYLFLRQHENAVKSARQGSRHQNLHWSSGPDSLASALGHLGWEKEAHHAVEELNRLRPGITVGFVQERLPITDRDYMDHMLEGLRKAGVPE